MKIKNYKLNKFLKYYLPLLSWALVIFLFSSYQTSRSNVIHWQDFIVKKTAHLVEYAIFAILVFRVLKKENVKNRYIYAVLIALIYGASDEFHQSFTPGREPTVRDVIIDTVGAIAGLYLVVWKLPQYKKFKKLVKKINPLVELW